MLVQSLITNGLLRDLTQAPRFGLVWFNQAQVVAGSENPCSLHRSFIATLASASRKNPTIWTSENRFSISNLLPV